MKLGLLGVVLILAAGCAPTLAGQLTVDGRGPVFGSDARVNVTSLGGGDAPRVLVLPVDGDGRFATDEELPPGNYLVEALVPGYALASQHVQVNGTSTVALSLKPLGKETTHVMHANAGVDEGRGAGGVTLTPPSL